MNVSADAPFISRPARNLAAGAMSLGVHVLFVLLLVFGVSWQTQRPEPVMVDLWDALPPLPSPVPAEPQVVPPPQPEAPPPPEPVKAPEPAKLEAPPAPAVKTPAPPKAPDIALEKERVEKERLEKERVEKERAEAERKQRLKAMQEAEALALAEAARAEAEAMRRAREKQVAEQKKREMLRVMEEEAMMQRMAEEEAASEARLIRQAEARAAASKRQSQVSRIVAEHRNQISQKIRSNTRLPDDLKGNPEVRCKVRLLPTGEVLKVEVSQPSGNPAYDEAVINAIRKSSPLPLPEDRDARAEFVPELSIVHRPKE